MLNAATDIANDAGLTAEVLAPKAMKNTLKYYQINAMVSNLKMSFYICIIIAFRHF